MKLYIGLDFPHHNFREQKKKLYIENRLLEEFEKKFKVKC